MKWTTICGLCALSLWLAGCASEPRFQQKSQPDRASQINVDLAIDAFRKGNLAQSKEKLDRALEQNPRNPAAHAFAGMLYDRLGEQNKAESHYQRAVALEPENFEFKNNYAVYLCQKGKFARGEKLALEAAASPLYQSPEMAYVNAGYCARSGGDIAAAEQHFRRALTAQPRFTEALLQMAEIEYDQKDYLAARAFLERYMAAGRTTPATLWLGVKIERELGNAAVSQHYAQRLKREYPHANQTKELVESERNPG